MSLLQQLIENVRVYEPEYNKSRIIDWSAEDNKLKVKCAQDVFLEEYFYIEDDHEVTIPSLEFTVNCTVIYTVLSSDVSLGNEIEIFGGHIAYDSIADLRAESSDPHYNEKTLIDDLMDELLNPGPQPAIDMPIPRAIVMFVEL